MIVVGGAWPEAVKTSLIRGQASIKTILWAEQIAVARERKDGCGRGVRALVAAIAIVLIVLIGAGSGLAATLLEPGQRWQTLVTTHFRVNYPSGYDEIAHRAAAFAEEAHQRLVPYMQSEPQQRTELTLLDNADTVNGLALPLPNNAVYVYLTSPGSDEKEYGHYDDWLRTVITHEYTHILHFESVGGLVDSADKLFGRLLFPNLVPGQPFFLIEGLAVTGESTFTSGGRGRGCQYDMMLRADALDHRLLSIDQAGTYYLDRWPGGNAVYVYGTFFHKYLRARYGAKSAPAIAKAYGTEPWLGINQAFKRVIGRDLYQVWDEFIAALKRRAVRQRDQIASQPLTQFKLLTHSGRYHRHPVFLPDGRLAFSETLEDAWPQVVAVDPAKPATLSGLFYRSPYGTLTPTHDGHDIYFASARGADDLHTYNDLYRYECDRKQVVRLTRGKRASEPAVSPDGSFLLAVLNAGGQNNLALFDRGGTLLRRLTDNHDGTQYSGLTWAPNGSAVAAAVWQHGRRSICLIDPQTGNTTPLTRDSASNYDPAWSPDGAWLLYSSDRTGVSNIHAVRLGDGRLFRVTNVLTGAFEPTVSPDSKTIAFAVYTSEGYDIATMKFDPGSWRQDDETVFAPVDDDGTFAPVTSCVATQVVPIGVSAATSSPYNPWDSLRPKAWAPNVFMPDERGGGAGIYLAGSDVLLQHTFEGTFGLGLSSLRPQYSLYYTNDVWPPTLGLSLSDLPAAYPVSSKRYPGQPFASWREEKRVGASVTYPGVPSRLLANVFVSGGFLTVGLSNLNSATLGTQLPESLRQKGGSQASAIVPSQPLGPEFVNPPGVPRLGNTTAVDIRYQFADSYQYGRSISPEGGSLCTLDYTKANPVWGSDVAYDHVSLDYRTFVRTFVPHHVLALRLAGGANSGAPEGGFLLGGYSSSSLISLVDVRGLGPFQSIPLRGFGYKSGDRLLALNSEYRFPIGEMERGAGTLPLFFERWYGVVSYDAGNVWSGAYVPNGLRQSVGLEARMHFAAMNVPLELRVGLAQSTGPIGPASLISPAARPAGAWQFSKYLMPPPVVFWEVGTFF